MVIDLYFDFISHNAYLAWSKLPELATRHGHEVRAVPILFAGLLAHHGQLGPAEIPDKSYWMVRNVMRKAARHGIPFAPPVSHPFRPLLALRAAAAASDDIAHQVIDAIFRATWAESLDVTDPEVVAERLEQEGLPGRALVEAAGHQEVKDQVRQNTERAIARSVFGVPTMCVGDELFYGFDDFPQLEAFLEGDDPIAGVDMRPWLAVRPSAQRVK